MSQDAQGHPLSGATEAAVADYDQAVRAFNLVHGDSVGLFERARAAAPEFAMAHLGKARVFAVANDPGLLTQVGTLAETSGGDEEGHVGCLRRWLLRPSSGRAKR